MNRRNTRIVMYVEVSNLNAQNSLLLIAKGLPILFENLIQNTKLDYRFNHMKKLFKKEKQGCQQNIISINLNKFKTRLNIYVRRPDEISLMSAFFIPR